MVCHWIDARFPVSCSVALTSCSCWLRRWRIWVGLSPPLSKRRPFLWLWRGRTFWLERGPDLERLQPTLYPSFSASWPPNRWVGIPSHTLFNVTLFYGALWNTKDQHFLLRDVSVVISLFVFPLQSVREQDVRALILVPTKELGQQVQTMMRLLTSFCSRDVRVADISGKADVSTQRWVFWFWNILCFLC